MPGVSAAGGAPTCALSDGGGYCHGFKEILQRLAALKASAATAACDAYWAGYHAAVEELAEHMLAVEIRREGEVFLALPAGFFDRWSARGDSDREAEPEDEDEAETEPDLGAAA